MTPTNIVLTIVATLIVCAVMGLARGKDPMSLSMAWRRRRRSTEGKWQPWSGGVAPVDLATNLLQDNDVLLLEFADGDLFNLVRAVKDCSGLEGGWEFVLENLGSEHGGYISDVPLRFLRVSDPKRKDNSKK